MFLPKEIWLYVFFFTNSLTYRLVCKEWSNIYNGKQLVKQGREAPGKKLDTPFIRSIISEYLFIEECEYTLSFDNPEKDHMETCRFISTINFCNGMVKYECVNYFRYLLHQNIGDFVPYIINSMKGYDKPIFLKQIYERYPSSFDSLNVIGRTNWRLALHDLKIIMLTDKERVFHALIKGDEKIIGSFSGGKLLLLFESIFYEMRGGSEEEDGFTNYPFFLEMVRKYTPSHTSIKILLSEKKVRRCKKKYASGNNCIKLTDGRRFCIEHSHTKS